MVTVATEALGSLLATESLAHHAAWLAYLAAPFVAGGLAVYPFLLTRFRLGDLVSGLGDQWVTGGSLAISSLATAQLARAAVTFGVGGRAALVIGDLALALWIVSALWIAPLVTGELTRPRLAYHSQRWASVFPLGMYAVSGFAVAGVSDATVLTEFSRVWLWVAVAGWSVVAAAMGYRGWAAWRTRGAVKLGHA